MQMICDCDCGLVDSDASMTTENRPFCYVTYLGAHDAAVESSKGG